MRRMLDPKELGGGGGGGGEANTLYEYTAVFLDESNLGIKAYAKLYSSVDSGQNSKFRTSQELYNQLLPGGSKYELSLNLTGYAKIDTNYYSLRRMTFGTSNIKMYYLDPATGFKVHSHDLKYDTINTWQLIRNIASPRKAN